MLFEDLKGEAISINPLARQTLHTADGRTAGAFFRDLSPLLMNIQNDLARADGKGSNGRRYRKAPDGPRPSGYQQTAKGAREPK